MELGERKLKVLAAIVEAYVATGEPVGSKAVCNALDFPVSSATIRNEMAGLVELGLLAQPHTSAGRIPSALGYRLYINRLMHRRPLSDEEKRYIDGTLASITGGADDLLEEASQMLAGMTRFIAVSTAPTDEGAAVRRLQFVQTGRRSAIVVLTSSTGNVKSRQFRCDYDITPEVMNVFHVALNKKFMGVPLAEITPALVQSMAASFGELTMLMPAVLTAVLETAQDMLQTDIRLEGQTNLLFMPEFELYSVRQILDFLNRRGEIAKLLNRQEGAVKVLIGAESGQPELIDSSLVVARYRLGGRTASAIGVIGPTRMDYAKMISSLEYFAQSMGKLLSEILEEE